MSLPNDLVSRFAKIINSKEQTKKETPQYGTIKVQNGIAYVQLDGSNRLTPMLQTVEVAEGDRVTVSVKNHTATVTGNLTDRSASSNYVGIVYDKTTGAITTAENASKTASRASVTATNANKAAAQATEKASEASTAANDAAKTADNYLYYDDQNGLQVGDKRSGSWVGFRSRMTSSTFDILNAAGTVLASYGANLVELGKNAVDTVIKLCGGKGKIEYDADDDYLQVNADNVRLKGNSIASVYSTYTDDSTRWEKSAVNVKPKEVHLYSEECIDPTMVEHTEGWQTSEVYVKPDSIDMSSERFNITGTMYDTSIGGTYLSCFRGSSGIWKYRQWSDGQVELWGTFTISNVACTTALGNMYRTGSFSSPSFPFTVKNPVVTASYESTGYGAMLWPTTVSSSSAPPSYYLIRPTSATIASGQIHFYVRGTY